MFTRCGRHRKAKGRESKREKELGERKEGTPAIRTQVFALCSLIYS